MDPLWMGLGIGCALLLFVVWLVRMSTEPARAAKSAAEAKAKEADVDALRRAAGLYMGRMPDDERRAFEKASRIVRARVLSTMQTGETINLRVVLDIDLKVEAPEGAYEVQVKEPIQYKDLARFEEGREVDVYANPNDKTKVLLCDPEIAALDREMKEMKEEDARVEKE
ncbi:MAG TPA: hypothetical protein VGG39_32780 [Polyangiaceae bacterium]